MKIKIGIIGAAGYTGGELIRILMNHESAEIVFAHSKSQAGNHLHHVHHDLIGETDLRFTHGEIPDEAIDLLFLCVGHGEAKKFLETTKIADRVKIIDLSQDFRLAENAHFGERYFMYGLPELNRESIRTAKNIANPGCFATTIELGLLPLAKEGLINEVFTTGITGSTGAGQGLTSTSHFSWRANNIQAYKTLSHQHLGEINQSLRQLQPGQEPNIYFVPWRGDFTRGIFVSSTLNCDWNIDKLEELFKDYYANHPFVGISSGPISLKQVVNTNKAVIQMEKAGDKLVVHSTTDNLLKGASGQAVQNMNLVFGLEETAGLRLKAAAF